MKPLTKKWANLVLPAVRKLIRYYRQEIDFDECPLCALIRNKDKTCRDICPWYIFEKMSCLRYSKGNFGAWLVCDLREQRQGEWVEDSFKRLRRWERKLKAILAKPVRGAK